MFDEKSYSLKMDKAIEVFSKELSSLRTVSYTHLTLPTEDSVDLGGRRIIQKKTT